MYLVLIVFTPLVTKYIPSSFPNLKKEERERMQFVETVILEKGNPQATFRK